MIQSTSPPIHFHLMELFLLLKTIRRHKPRSLRVLIPYYSYSRQASETAHFIAELISFSGATQIITVDLHQPLPPCLSLSTAKLMAQDIQKRWTQDSVQLPYVIVAPDNGGIERAQTIASLLKVDLVCISKKRTPLPIVEQITGSPSQKRALIIDDLVDSGQTLLAVTKALYEAGAVEVHGYITHGLFSGQGLETVNASSLLSLTMTDSIEPSISVVESPKIRLLSIASLITF